MIANEIQSDEKGAKTHARRRARARKSCSGEATIELLAGDAEVREMPAKLVDMSDYGVGFETVAPVEVGSRVAISSQFFNSSATASCRREARVVHCALQAGKVYRSGACFEREKASGPGADLEDTVARAGAGPLPDHYEVLQISVHADPEMIQRAYTVLLERYGDAAEESRNTEALRLIEAAHHVLSDPERRAAYDVQHQKRAPHWQSSSKSGRASPGEEEKETRRDILAALYTVQKAQTGGQDGLTIKELEDLLLCPREHLEFHLWYLSGKSQVALTGHSRFVITPEGVDIVEEQPRRAAPDLALLESAHLS
jgi:DnaJ domain